MLARKVVRARSFMFGVVCEWFVDGNVSGVWLYASYNKNGELCAQYGGLYIYISRDMVD